MKIYKKEKVKTNSKLESLSTSIKHYDIFGDPISLSYKGYESHHSVLGGVISLLYIIMIIIYIAWRLFVFLN